MEFHDQRQSNGAGECGDQGKGQAQERTGQMMGSLEEKAHEGGDPIYDAIREAKEERTGQVVSSLENKSQGGGDPIYDAIQEAKEVMKLKAQKEKTGEYMNPMDQTDKGVLTIDKKDD
ncbi:late embryogenesis abundant protein 2-like [Pyrus communis]|uniref:late embryogenesis abundant protein 2-like n=1 Tax=Pyrus communis TaxID=23211 RepID=UPI0035BEFA6E